MKKEVTVIDYGIGNLYSVKKAFEHCGARVIVTNTPSAIVKAKALVLPGVGAFSNGMIGLEKRNLVKSIKEYCDSGRPFLGICLGMQLLLDYTEEFGCHRGLGVLHGKVIAIPDKSVNGKPQKIPHIGWSEINNTLQPSNWDSTILHGLNPGFSSYFLHSYMAVPDDLSYQLAVSKYNDQEIIAVIKSGVIYGCQFHPEKSGEKGLCILSNFINL